MRVRCELDKCPLSGEVLERTQCAAQMGYKEHLSRPMGVEGSPCPYFAGWAEGGVVNCTFGDPVAEAEPHNDRPLLLQEVVNNDA